MSMEQTRGQDRNRFRKRIPSYERVNAGDHLAGSSGVAQNAPLRGYSVFNDFREDTSARFRQQASPGHYEPATPGAHGSDAGAHIPAAVEPRDYVPVRPAAASSLGTDKAVEATLGSLRNDGATMVAPSPDVTSHVLLLSFKGMLFVARHCILALLTGAAYILVVGLLMQALCRYEVYIPERVGHFLPRPLCMQVAPVESLTSVTLESIAVEIDRRLLRAAQDDLGLRDYASHAAGARPIKEFTSRTYDARWSITRLFAPVLPSAFGEKRSSAMVLKRSLQPGNCWSMAGSSGHIGIKLADPVFVRNITIDHFPPSLARDSRTAPRSVLVWAVVPASAAVTTDIAARVEHLFPLRSAVSTKFTVIPIAEIEYDILKAQHIQTFAVDKAVHSLKIEEIVLQVLNNWGSSESTCLYRVRVHGEPDGAEAV